MTAKQKYNQLYKKALMLALANAVLWVGAIISAIYFIVAGLLGDISILGLSGSIICLVLAYVSDWVGYTLFLPELEVLSVEVNLEAFNDALDLGE